MKSNVYLFTLDISYHTFQQHYAGVASTVVVKTDNGLTLQLPASRLRPYLSQLGLKGRFRLVVDEANRFKSLELIV
ncbi:hypothetical protein A1OO_08280 [Enterovibrio norvegicus FF-33]|uniref:Topoisomerase II n=1 Tax=Enterovibrio norvegicus FF-454 TaxID=1185651 RepID=A0A1E5CAK2_9GAMM|nr:DUF2835 domain-containing protein [Enterovibrio norvegicus]OEE62212.1 hypothetical protein A1OK_01510 [Enterovibrio norvegicus FF-454]OEE65797.1 hypothetical protein A1OO_08280 [Enterovibrio norvegicus FF-33]OEE89171.1 hypothetical protein A1OQ_12315 [Enterovibrio norvegicus FF-162]